MTDQLKKTSDAVKTELNAYRLAMAHKDTPRSAKLLLGTAIGYTLLPFDLIPDFIPVIGLLDDFIVVPLILLAASGMIPPEVMKECREKAKEQMKKNI